MKIITIDIDWVPDFIIEEVASLLIDSKVKSTWFVTHSSPAIDNLRNYPDLFELGIHPNFYPGSSHGNTEDEVMGYIKEIVPDAISMRTHGLYQNSNFLMKAVEKYGITYDVSLLLPYMSHIYPHYLRFWDYPKELIRIPFYWEDDLELFLKNPSWNSSEEKYNATGLKIFNFHPIHLALNSCTYDSYKSLKADVSISKCKPEDIRKYRNEGKGVFTLFMSLVQELTGNGKKVRDIHQ